MSATVLQRIAELHPDLIDRMRVVDGDTFWAYAKMPLYRKIEYVEYRLDGGDTPEKQGADTTLNERLAAQTATAESRRWFLSRARLRRIFVETREDPEKYGRWLAKPWAEDAEGHKEFLLDHLISMSLAVVSDGTKGTRWRDTYGVKS